MSAPTLRMGGGSDIDEDLAELPGAAVVRVLFKPLVRLTAKTTPSNTSKFARMESTLLQPEREATILNWLDV